MCGIAGVWGQGAEAVPAMLESIKHRGPDGGGIWRHEASGVTLGHRRLSILDHAGGAQPFAAGDDGDGGGYVLVYNGELYNHPELRAELEKRGHVFRSSHSDTETVLHAYMEWGEEAPARFNGMFALAIWDKARRRLFLARDRFGEKPLFWAAHKDGFAFASEVQALFHWPLFSGRLHAANVQRYLAWGYCTADRTIFEGVHSLPAGSCLTLHLGTGQRDIRRYWRFALEPDEAISDADEPRLVEELRALLVQAVQRRLASDVPLGVFLSGGVDSSAVLAAMSRLLPAERIHAFSVGFTEKSFDESAYAAEVARYFGVRHHIRKLDLDAAQERVRQLLPRVGDPLGDASLLPTALLAEFTRESVTVALSGDGGDELFAGYDPFKALTPAMWYSRCMPRPLHQLLRRGMNLVPSSDANMSLDFKIRRFLRGLSSIRPLWMPVWMSPVEPAEMGELFASPLPPEELYADQLATWERNRHLSLPEQAQAFFVEHYLSGDILVKTDRASMLSSLESRAVFLDNDIADFCRRLPFRFKMRKGVTKYILKKALAGWLPETIINRPKKGFGIPLNLWLRSLPLPAFPGEQCPWMLPEGIRQRADAQQRRRGDHRLFLWAWLALAESAFFHREARGR